MANHTRDGAARFGVAPRRATALTWALFIGAVVGCRAGSPGVAAEPAYVAVRSEIVAETLEAYAQVEPMAAVSVQPTTPGVVTHLDVMPGAVVKRGQRLAELSGPEIDAALARARAGVASAEAKLASAQKALAADRQQLASHLVTQQQVLEAESGVADARGAAAIAKADLAAVETTSRLTAMTDGTVTTVSVANGQRVGTGDTILTLAPANALTVKATVYGADASHLRVGMQGTFTPDSAAPAARANPPGEPDPASARGNGGHAASPSPAAGEPSSTALAVVVLAVAPSTDGGLTVWLRPASSAAALRNGAFGTVALTAPARSVVAVPTGALILDQGRWWVLVHTAQGEQPREVQPGPSRGWETLIEHGLAPGAQVVVGNAYLLFHRNISAKYQAPD